MRREDWADLATFAAIAEAGSFTAAAARLGVSPSATSHAMRALEARLGIRLLNRTTRSVAPTEAGERLLASLGPAMRDVAGTLEHLKAERERPAGRIRISAHRTAATQLIMPRMASFTASHPDVTVELSIEDGLVDIVAGRFDAGVRHEQMLDQDMVSVRIGGPQRTAIVACPDHFARFGVPLVPEDLARHRCLAYRYTSSGTIHRWVFTREDRSFALDPPAVFIADDADVLLDAALRGLGVACVLESQAARHVASGALVAVLGKWCPLVPPNYLYYPSRRHLGAALRAFIEALRRPDS